LTPTQSLQLILAVLSLILGLYVVSTRRLLPLAAFLLTIAVHSGLRTFKTVVEPDLLIYSFSLGFLYGPLIYITVLDILEGSRPSAKTLFQFVPAAYVLFDLHYHWSSLSTLSTVLCVYTFVYVLLCYRIFTEFSNNLMHNRASERPVQLFWLRRALDLFLAVVILQTGRVIGGLVFSSEVSGLFESLFFILAVCCMALLIFRGLRTPFVVPVFDEEERALTREVTRKPRGTLSAQQRALRQQLEQQMMERKPFLNPTISVTTMAKEMGIQGRQLSELINDAYGYNFSEFINRARVSAAQELIKAQPDNPVLNVAYDSGFNSKSSFNLMFKRFTGVTPTVYRKQLSS
jgi:AraC-like DNA-binding protein